MTKEAKSYPCQKCGAKRPRVEMLKSKAHDRYICNDECDKKEEETPAVVEE
jgi:hypothetical protein